MLHCWRKNLNVVQQLLFALANLFTGPGAQTSLHLKLKYLFILCLHCADDDDAVAEVGHVAGNTSSRLVCLPPPYIYVFISAY